MLQVGGVQEATTAVVPGWRPYQSYAGAVVLASLDRAFAKQLADTLRSARLDVSISSDVTGVELAGCAKNAAVLAAAAASIAGPNVAGAAAGMSATFNTPIAGVILAPDHSKPRCDIHALSSRGPFNSSLCACCTP